MFIYFKKNFKYIISLIGAAIIHNLLSMKIQFIKGEILDIAIAGETKKILTVISFFVIFLITQIFFQQMAIISRIRMCAAIARDIKNRVFETVSNRHISAVDKVEKSTLITRYTTDIQMIEANFLSMGGRLFEHVTVILISGITLFLIHYKIAILTFIVFIIPMFITNALKSTISKAETDYIEVNQSHIDKLLKYLKGLEAIKNYSIEKEIDKHYTGSLDEVTRADMKRAFMRSLANGMSFFTTMISQAAILIYASYLLYTSEISAGTFVTIFSLVMVLRPPFYWISQLYESVIASRPAIQSVFGFIKENEENSNKALSAHDVVVSRPENEGEIRIENLSYSYPDVKDSSKNGGKQDSEKDGRKDGGGNTNGKKIFDHFNLHIKKGEKVLISGPSGSGKTTLINLIIGRLLPDEGKVELGSSFSYFRQEAFLFNASFADNLTMFREDVPEEKIRQIAEVCGLKEMYLEKKDIGESGSNLSGGEKKRVSLARTLIDDQKIWILDEPFANIDAKNIDAIEDLILNDKEHTILIISHIVSDNMKKKLNRIVDITSNRTAVSHQRGTSSQTARHHQGGRNE